MIKDKAIQKAVQSQPVSMLSSGFDSRIMDRIRLETEKKKKRAYVLSLGLISVVSAGLISLAVYLFKDELPAHLTLRFPDFNVIVVTLSKYGFGFYVAFLALILIGMDYFLRNAWQKKNDHKLNQSG